jgi:hypothetical protein
MFDLRIPSGWFFLITGAILLLLGIAMPNLRAPLTTANVNLYSGLSMTAFGGILLWLAHRTS